MGELSFYDSFVPIVVKGLNSLDGILTKAEGYAKEKGIDADAEFVSAKLAEDMLPLTFQIQAVSNGVKKSYTRITGKQLDEWKDDEKTFAELHTRIAKTLELMTSVKREDVDGKAGSEVDV